MLMTTVHLPGAAAYDSQMKIYTSTTNTDISLAREFQNIFQTQHVNMAFWITVGAEKCQ